MIMINEDKKVREPLKRPSRNVLKGETINNLLVLEDILDLSVSNRSLRYRCICKCLKCGRIMENVRSWDLKHGRVFCQCTVKNNHYKFKDLKGKMLKFLVSERNRAQAEMLFEEDAHRVKEYDTIINFLQSRSLKKYFQESY